MTEEIRKPITLLRKDCTKEWIIYPQKGCSPPKDVAWSPKTKTGWWLFLPSVPHGPPGNKGKMAGSSHMGSHGSRKRKTMWQKSFCGWTPHPATKQWKRGTAKPGRLFHSEGTVLLSCSVHATWQGLSSAMAKSGRGWRLVGPSFSIVSPAFLPAVFKGNKTNPFCEGVR